MPYTLFNSLTATTGLIPQPGRAVNTFPSGLVRVDQTYLGLTANAATHRAILAVGNDMPDGDTSPCIDGLKIFPEAQERRREDGWTEYIVSAYGRFSSGQSNSTLKKIAFQELTLSLSPLVGFPKLDILYYAPIKKTAAQRGQIPSLTIQPPTFQFFPAESISGTPVQNEIIELPSNISKVRAPGYTGFLGSTSKKWATKTFNPSNLSVVYRVFSHAAQEIININSLNFGDFDELVVEYDFVPYPTLGTQSDIELLDSNGNLVAMVSSLF
jgi:hypothetical protein